MADNRNLAPTWATKAGFGVLTLNSGLAIYRSWGDLVSILVASGSYTILLLLFRCLRDYERAAPGSPAKERARRAVWPLTTLLTVGFAWKVAAVMPLAVGVLVFVCLRDVDQVIRAGDVDGRVANLDVQYSALAKVGFALVTCDAALDDLDTRRGPGSAALALLSYAVLVILTGLFVRTVARAHAGDGDHGQGQG